MKYIKTFESSNRFEEIKNDILDVFADMVDDGLDVKVFCDSHFSNHPSGLVTVLINFKLPPHPSFNDASMETKKLISSFWDAKDGKKLTYMNNPIIKRIQNVNNLEIITLPLRSDEEPTITFDRDGGTIRLFFKVI